MERQLAFWKERLAAVPQVLDLPMDRPRPAVSGRCFDRHRLVLPPALVKAVGELGRREEVPTFVVLMAAWAVLLGRHAGQEQLLLGTPAVGRYQQESAGPVGTFNNTLALPIDLAGEPSFRKLLERVHELVLEAFTRPDVPFDRLVEELAPNRDPSRPPLTQALFKWTEFPLMAAEAREAGGGANYDLSLALVADDSRLSGVLESDCDLFDSSTAERFVVRYERLLLAATAEPELSIHDLPLIPDAERHQVLVEHNDAPVVHAGESRIHDLIADQVTRFPEAVAISKDGQTLRYGELAELSDRLAWRLSRLGVGPDVLVAICVQRSPAMLVGLLGILKAGGAYVPLDPTHPRERLGYILADSGSRILLTERELLSGLPAHEVEIVLLDEPGEREEIPASLPLCHPENLAYVIYTSGSTGRPKGVEVPHRGVVNYLTSMAARPGLGRGDVMIALTTLTFDISVTELLLPLTVGARIELVSREVASDSALLAATLDSAGATCLQVTPATWTLLLDGGWSGRPGLLALCGGEALPRSLADRLLPRVRELWNVYGPTETTVWSSLLRVGSEEGAIPLGLPLGNMALHVLARDGSLAPLGVIGELAINGPGLARGYHGRPDLTAERFLPDLFGAPGTRLYRTGDLARRLVDGTLEFLGRLDHQVKVRGFRIELGEIEAVLASHPGVRSCVVVARQDRAADKRLVAYVVPEEQGGPDLSTLRSFLGERLPAYMIPAAFVTLPSLPLSSNGKIDRKALPAPPRERPELAGELVPPRTAIESALVAIWSSALDLDEIGVKDDFFALGGHSLLALRVVTAIRDHFGVELPLAVLFRAPTIERMAALLDGTATAPASHLVLMAGAEAPGAPLFCVHGIGGHVFRLVHLAQQLGVERPFYGIQGWSDLNDISHMASVEVMAERYLAAIRQIQPTGPYRLAGYSLGGVVAYEMARRLTAMGESIAWLGMLDASVPRPPEPLPPGKIISFEAGLAEELGFAVDIEHIRQLAPEERLGYVVGEGIRVGVLPQGFTVADGQRYIHVFYANFAAFQRYAPQPWEGRLAVFRTAAEAATNPDSTLGWGTLAGGGVDLFEVPGDHITLVRSPNVELLAQNISLSLARVEAPTVSARSEENPMNAESLLFPRTDELLLPGDFRTIGAPALLVTNESTPTGFHDHLRETVAPDGWIYGPGCGNVLSLVEAFAGTPRGMVLVDVDPAVVLAGRMLVAALRRYPDAASFTSGFFCGGREPLAILEGEVLESEPSALLRAAMNGQRERLWRTLATLTEGFSLQPGDADRLLTQWASHYPPAGHLVPVRTFLARNYSRLREMALRGDIAVLCSSLFHPGLLAAVAELPGWRGGRNVIYLSNVADHVLRRTLMANARARLRVVAEEPQRTLRSTAEFVTVLNAEQVGVLREVDTRGTVYVASSAKNGLTLTAVTELPVFQEDDFGIDFNLDRNVVRFFEAFAGPASAEGALPAPWSEGRSLRALVLRLYSAAVRGDEAAAGALLGQLASWLGRQPWEADPLWTAFWLAEIGHGLLILRRTPTAAALVPETAVLHQPIEAAAAALLSRVEDFRTSAAEPPLPALLGSVGLILAGEVLGDERLITEGRSLGEAARTSNGRFTLPGSPAAAAQAEALLRLTVWQIHCPQDDVGVALTRVAAALLPAIRGNGDVSRDGVEGQGSGYAAYLAEPEVLFETVKLALLFYGLSAEEGMAIEAALQVDYHARHRQIAETPDTDVLLGASR